MKHIDVFEVLVFAPSIQQILWPKLHKRLPLRVSRWMRSFLSKIARCRLSLLCSCKHLLRHLKVFFLRHVSSRAMRRSSWRCGCGTRFRNRCLVQPECRKVFRALSKAFEFSLRWFVFWWGSEERWEWNCRCLLDRIKLQCKNTQNTLTQIIKHNNCETFSFVQFYYSPSQLCSAQAWNLWLSRWPQLCHSSSPASSIQLFYLLFAEDAPWSMVF